MNFEIKYFVAALSILLIIGGLYFKFLYDVPDGQDQVNAVVSWLLTVLGIIGIIIAILWKKRINPIINEYDDDESDDTVVESNSDNISKENTKEAKYGCEGTL